MIFSYVLDKLSCFMASQNDFLYVQSGTKCGVGSHRTCSHFFWIIALILTIFDKKYRTLTRRDKRESYLIVLQQNKI